MPASISDLTRTVEAFRNQRGRVIELTVDGAIAWFSRINNFYAPDPQLVGLRRIARVVAAGQVGVARLTDAYLSRTSSMLRDARVSPVGVPQYVAESLRFGVESHEQVYERGAAEYRRHIAAGKSKSEALELAVNRVSEMVRTDLGLAHRDQANRFARTRNVARYRRVVTGEGTCGLCIAASHRLYYKADLLPIHGGCRCEVLETTTADDPGAQINQDFLEKLYEEAGSTAAADLRRVTVDLTDHGELGPTLVVKGENVRTALDVARDSSKKTFWEDRDAMQAMLARTVKLPDSTWKTEYIAKLEATIATV